MKKCCLIKFVKIGTKDGNSYQRDFRPFFPWGPKTGSFFFSSAWVAFVCSTDFSFSIVIKASARIIRSRVLMNTVAPSLTACMTGKLSRRQLWCCRYYLFIKQCVFHNEITQFIFSWDSKFLLEKLQLK